MESKLRKYSANAEEVADILGYTLEHIRKLARDGTLPAVKFGRKWRFDLKEIEEKILGTKQEDTRDAQTDQPGDVETALNQIIQ